MFTARTRRASRNTKAVRRPSIRLHVDQLEVRAVPATIAWDGGPTGMGTNWLDRVNWVGDVLPGANDDAVVAAGNASQLTQIPISGQVNANLRDNYGSDFPVAPTDVVVGSVPFHLVPQDSVPDSLGIIEAPLGQSVYTIPTNVAHPTVVYTLMNSVFGNIGDDVATMEFVGAQGAHASFELIEGMNIRSYFWGGNHVIAPGTPSVGFGPQDEVRLDRQIFILPNSFSNDTLTEIIFTGHGGSDLFNAFLAGVTVGDQPIGVTIPGSAAVHSAKVDRNLQLTSGELTIGAAESSFADIAFDGGTITPLDGATIAHSTIDGQGSLSNPAGVTITVIDTAMNVSFTNHGTLVARPGVLFNGGLTAPVGSTVRIVGDSSNYWQNSYGVTVTGDLTNYGTIEMVNDNTEAILTVQDGILTNTSTGSIFDTSGIPYNSDWIFAPVDNQGTIAVGTDSDLEFAQDADFTNSGVITIDGRLDFAPFSGPGSITNSGSISVGASGLFVASNLRFESGALAGPGRIVLYGDAVFLSDFSTSGDVLLVLGGTLDGPGTVTNTSGHTLTIRGSTVNAPVVNQGTLSLEENTTVNASLVNQGDMQVAYGSSMNTIAGNFTNAVGSTVEIQSPLIVTLGFMNLGTVVMGASYLIANGPIVNAPQGTINSQSYNMTLQASLDNQGTLNVSNSLNWKNRGASLNTGTINVSGFATILTLDQSAAGSSFSTSGTVTVGSGDTFTVLQGGYSQSAGTTEVAGMLLVNGNFHPGSGTVAVALNGTTPGTSYGQIKVNGTVALGGPLNVALGYTPSIGDSFRIIDNDGADPISGTFSGLPERAILTTGGQTFRVSYVGGTGNDVTLTRYNPGAASVTSLVVGDGSAQRSSIKQIKVSFDRIISYVGLPSDAYSLQVVNGGFVGLSIATVTVGDHSEVTLTFTSDVSFGSLNDGRYIFTVHGAQIVSDGLPMTSDVLNNFFRMYGDATGDGIVNGADLSSFASTFGKKAGDVGYLSYFDYNGDGVVNGLDLGQFRVRFGTTLP